MPGAPASADHAASRQSGTAAACAHRAAETAATGALRPWPGKATQETRMAHCNIRLDVLLCIPILQTKRLLNVRRSTDAFRVSQGVIPGRRCRQFQGTQMSQAKRDNRHGQTGNTDSQANEYDGARGAGPAGSFGNAAGSTTLEGTVALLRFDIGAARAAVRYRDERIAALEATLRDVLQPGDHEDQD
jgi:hypothetical protein